MAESTTAAEVLVRKVQADRIIEETAKELRSILRSVVQELDPFPIFPESQVQAIEAEPGGSTKANLGCVVVCPDGELYELVVNIDFSGESFAFVNRREDLRELHISSQDYIAYAYNAIAAVTAIIMDRAEGKSTL